MKAKSRVAYNRRWELENYLLMLPYFAFFFIFTLLPVLLAILLGFTDYNMLQPPKLVGWDNYLRMFIEDDIFLIALKNTLIFAAVTGPISYILCFLFAWLINELRPKTRAVMTTLYYAPALSGQAYTIFLFFFSNDQYGLINGLLMKLGIVQEPVLWLADAQYIMKVLIIVQLWLSLGTGFLAFIAGLQGLDKSLFDACLIDGVRNRLQELWYVTLPQMKPALAFGAVMQIVSSFMIVSNNSPLASRV